MKISQEEKIILLKAARQSISYLFNAKEPEQPDYKKYPLLKEKLGAFVTLTINHQLRGCIGYIIGREPLFETICSAAVHAAVNDPRFSALKKPELEKIKIEISILSEFVRIKNYDEIIIGTHGLYLDEGNGGLLLPQVATEHKMNREQFLSAICNKSGFYSEFWKERVLKIKVFTAEIFSEEETEK
ncbi:MAG: AmmeMemoRadiSam system protein A [Ignavibacteriaceae bacterium]|nr:AmmeMemoRadiSam system protein A [Ignavibacterium sp.]MCC6254024.1 AmmeMemoRadiSam system protein A [Ignavibacteriaceae bacterium]HRP91770.1 AmmeMemoRadiSam system protein A [Ignavibacteriaceae bacterium]HRQ52894.1 AmmeMemoRadiSam system protein A [Ignavibacteriaceae bacterium]